jgi:hypothetical protein
MSSCLQPGLALRFRASTAADVTLTLKRVAGPGVKTSLGGFVFPARRGRNRVRFSGVMREGRPLSAGVYRVTASAGGPAPSEANGPGESLAVRRRVAIECPLS